jgi:hypothetical protein
LNYRQCKHALELYGNGFLAFRAGIIIGNGEKARDPDREGNVRSGSALGLEIYNMLRQAMFKKNTYSTKYHTTLFSAVYYKHDIKIK